MASSIISLLHAANVPSLTRSAADQQDPHSDAPDEGEQPSEQDENRGWEKDKRGQGQYRQYGRYDPQPRYPAWKNHRSASCDRGQPHEQLKQGTWTGPPVKKLRSRKVPTRPSSPPVANRASTHWISTDSWKKPVARTKAVTQAAKTYSETA